MTIIPAIDIINGKCVRLTHGNYSTEKIYHASPLEVAKQFDDAGFKRLHIVDLDGARTGSMKNLQSLKEICRHTKLQVDFGGGIKEVQDVAAVLDAGAAMVSLGSIAVKNPLLLEEWLLEFGPGKFFIGADVLDDEIMINGWQTKSGISIFDFIPSMQALGVTSFFCTDISKDGLLQGPGLKLYTKLLERFAGLNLTASGGVHNMDALRALKRAGCSAAIVGKAIYENSINLQDLAAF